MTKKKKIELYDVDNDFELALNKMHNMYLSGDVFIYPTDTVHCLGANPHNILALSRLQKITRPDFICESTLLIDSLFTLINYIDIRSEKHLDFLLSIWPNPISAILNLNKQSKELFGIDKAIFRIPNNRFCLKLLSEIKKPLLCIQLNYNHSAYKEYEIFNEEYSELVDAIFYTKKESYHNSSALIDLTNVKPIIIKENKFNVRRYLNDYKYVSY